MKPLISSVTIKTKSNSCIKQMEVPKKVILFIEPILSLRRFPAKMNL